MVYMGTAVSYGRGVATVADAATLEPEGATGAEALDEGYPAPPMSAPPVVAEGIETAEQAELLTREGCEYLQGFHFSRPVPAPGLLGLLRSGQRAGEPGRSFVTLQRAASP